MAEPEVRICFSRANDWLGEAIRAFTGGRVNHAFLAWKDTEFQIAVALGANPNGLTLSPYARFLKPPERVMCVFRAPASLWPGIRILAPLLDTPYDYGGVIAMSAVEVVHRWLRRWMPNPWPSKRMFCSEYVRYVLKLSGLDPRGLKDVPVGSTDPARLLQGVRDDGRFTLLEGGTNFE
jgi:hypothetical protein